MTSDKTLSIIIKANDQASKVLDQVANKADMSSKSIHKSLMDASGASTKFALALTATAAAAGGLLGYGAKVAGDLESARQGFVTLLGSADKADEVINRIKKDAAATPFELLGLIQANQQLTAVTKNGIRSEEVLMNVGKALAASGKGQAELDRIIANLQQIGLTGKITEMDVRQFGMSGINILELLGDYYGTTAAQAGEMVKDSSDAFADLEGAFAKAGGAGGQFAGAFTSQAGTFNQLMSNMRDSVSIFMADLVTQSGVFEMIKSGLAGIINFLEVNKQKFVDGLIATFGWIRDNGALLIGIIAGGLTPAFYALAVGIWATMAPLLPFMAAGAALGLILNTLANSFGGWSNVINIARTALSQVWAVVSAALMPSLSALWRTISNELIPSLMRAWEVLSPLLIPAMKILAVVVGATLIGALYIAINALNIMISTFSNLSNWIGNFYQVVASITVSVVSAIRGMAGGVSSGVSGIYGALTSPFEAAYRTISSIVDKIMGAVRNVTGAASKISDSAGGAAGRVGSWLNPFRAAGGPVSAGRPYIVGENEPELFVPNSSGQILNQKQMSDAGIGQGSVFNMYGSINLGSSGAVDRFFERLNSQKEMGELGVGI